MLELLKHAYTSRKPVQEQTDSETPKQAYADSELRGGGQRRPAQPEA